MKDQFLKLISDNQGLIFKVCNMYCNNKEDKEDLFQDIALQLWRAYPARKGDSKISTWVYRIAINNAITRLRKITRTEPFAELGDEASQVAVTENNEQERVRQMYQAIRNYPRLNAP
ncbi:MAG: polymerase subunit sigma-70 [Mucilaginibacter sp.]|nr:polymerase subunit sigma-70 [Mucilaginibacter sp.]